ncbi:MAG: 23S rRNA (uracil(1939)-C(5))-methyltransferase RlmD [Anaerolineae bacterium]
MGKRVELRLTDMAHGGDALGRCEGKVIFVPYTIPGEEALVEIVEDKGSYARARLVEVLSPSPHQVDPPCPHFGPGRCGGCQWQHIAYQAQMEFKAAVVGDQLARLGRLPDVPVKSTIPSASPWRYRNHVQFAVSDDGRLGFVATDGRRVETIEVCYLLHPLLEELFTALDLELPGLVRLSLRVGVNTGDQMIIFETHDDEPPALESDLPVSCILLLSDGTPVNLIGSNYITEEVAGRRFRISATSFFQVNTAAAEELVRVVGEYLAPAGGEMLLDAYCGVGTFALSLADKVGHVIGIEEDAGAVADARLNAAELANVEFIEGSVEALLPQLDRRIDLAMLDPPRQGCKPEALRALIELAPRRIVYVSCDPATLARDARKLVDGGYQLVEVQPVDMFPQTYHIESVALWERPTG